jgi:hypothetical protein
VVDQVAGEGDTKQGAENPETVFELEIAGCHRVRPRSPENVSVRMIRESSSGPSRNSGVTAAAHVLEAGFGLTSVDRPIGNAPIRRDKRVCGINLEALARDCAVRLQTTDASSGRASQ